MFAVGLVVPSSSASVSRRAAGRTNEGLVSFISKLLKRLSKIDNYLHDHTTMVSTMAALITVTIAGVVEACASGSASEGRSHTPDAGLGAPGGTLVNLGARKPSAESKETMRGSDLHSAGALARARGSLWLTGTFRIGSGGGAL